MTGYAGDKWSTTYDTSNTRGKANDPAGTTYDALASNYDPAGTGTYGATDYSAVGSAVGYGTDPTGTTYDTEYDTGYGTTKYDPRSGAYDQHLDYRTPTGRRHHRERVDQSGTYRHRDVDRCDDGSTRVHREYDNPNMGTSYHRDYER